MSDISYWVISTDAGFDRDSEDFFRRLMLDKKLFGFRKAKSLKIGDQICFYSGGKIIADATVASPVRNDRTTISALYPFVFSIEKVHFYMENSFKFDSLMRSKLDAFSKRDPDAMWSWFVRMPHRVTRHDFDILIGKSS